MFNFKLKEYTIIFLFIIISITFIILTNTQTNNQIGQISNSAELKIEEIAKLRNILAKLEEENKRLKEKEHDSNKISDLKRKSLVQDFYYYNCQDYKRIGGDAFSKDKKVRVEGGWFVCFDELLAPTKDNCNVLSFGINIDESFDYEMNTEYNCNVFSFDPIVEATRFKKIRDSNKHFNNSIMIPVNDKWKFYRMGITGSKENIKNKNQLGSIETLENILKLTGLENQIIDIFKIDIEVWISNKIVGLEQDILENLDIDYACKYFKQFLIETHSSDLNSHLLFDLLKRLGKCFSLFYRDTRFIGPNYNGEIFKEAAKQSFNISLAHFKNEINLIIFLLSTGELYFINENFLSK